MIGQLIRSLARDLVSGLELAFAAHREARFRFHRTIRLPAAPAVRDAARSPRLVCQLG